MKHRRNTEKSVDRLLKEGRGSGVGPDYKPWLVEQDVPSSGTAVRVRCHTAGGRTARFMSRTEAMYFYTLEWNEKVDDIREQFPLLPVSDAERAAKSLGYRYPKIGGERIVMTSDFRVTVRTDAGVHGPKIGNAVGYAIIGATGVGKSTAVLSVLDLYPKVIPHREHLGRPFTVQQVPALLLTCPADGSLKGLLYDFFRKLDEMLHTSYATAYGKGTTDRMITHMYTAAANHALGALVIDEIQHLIESPKRNTNADQMLNFFVGTRHSP